MPDYNEIFRPGQDHLGHTYASQPVFVSSGIQHFTRKKHPDYCFKCEYSSIGYEIVTPSEWLSQPQMSFDEDFVIRDVPNTSNSGLMPPTAHAALFAAGCANLLDRYPGEIYLVHGNSPEYYLDELISFGAHLLWDGWDKKKGTLLPHEIVRFSRPTGKGECESAVYTGGIPRHVAESIAAKLDSEAAFMLHESMYPLIRLLLHGKTGKWSSVPPIPYIRISEMSLGYLEEPEIRPLSRISPSDPIAALALKFASSESLEQRPEIAPALERFRTASAFGKIWEGLVRNADERGRAEHLHDILSSKLPERTESDNITEEWLSTAISTIGTALGVDYAFEAYLSGVGVEHIISDAE